MTVSVSVKTMTGGQLRFTRDKEDARVLGLMDFLEAWEQERKKRLEEERKLRSSSASHSSASSGGLSIDLSETSSGGMDLYHLDQLARQRSIDLSETSSGADSAEDARVSPTLAAGQKKSFVKFLENLRKARRGGSTRLADWNVAFAAFDLDRSGRLELAEFQGALNQSIGMDNRASPWFKRFVPELFQFMTQEHVASLGITGPEFALLLEVRTVEELDGFLGARSDAAMTELALDRSLHLDLGNLGRPGANDDSDDDDPSLVASGFISPREKGLTGSRHKWVWDCSVQARGRPVGGRAVWEEFSHHASRELDRKLEVWKRNPNRAETSLQINTTAANSASRRFLEHGDSKRRGKKFNINFAKKTQQSHDSRTTRDIDWTELSPGGTSDVSAPVLETQVVQPLPADTTEDVLESVATVVVVPSPPAPGDGTPSSRCKPAAEDSSSDPAALLVKRQLSRARLDLSEDSAVAAASGAEEAATARAVVVAAEKSLSLRAEPEPEMLMPATALPALPGQVPALPVPGATKLAKGVSFRQGQPETQEIGELVLERQPAAPEQEPATGLAVPENLQEQRALRGRLGRAIQKWITWGTVWSKARAAYPELPEHPSWVPAGEKVFSIVIGKDVALSSKAGDKDHYRDARRALLEQTNSQGSDSRVVMFNGIGGRGNERAGDGTRRMSRVFGDDELSGLREVLKAIGQAQHDNCCGDLRLEMYMQGWDDAPEVLDVVARAKVIFATVDVDVSATPSPVGNLRDWSRIWYDSSQNWIRPIRPTEFMSSISIVARQCEWIDAAVLEAITNFGSSLHSLNISDNTGKGEQTPTQTVTTDLSEQSPEMWHENRGAAVTLDTLVAFITGCKKNNVKGLTLIIKRSGLASIHLKELAKLSLSVLDVSHQRLHQGLADDFDEVEAFSAAAVEWLFKSQRQMWKKVRMFPDAPKKTRSGVPHGTELCWALKTFKAQTCGLNDAHVDIIRRSRLSTLTKVNLSGNNGITVDAQSAMRQEQGDLVAAYCQERMRDADDSRPFSAKGLMSQLDDSFELACTSLCWIDMLRYLGFAPSGVGQKPEDLVAWGRQFELEDVLLDEVSAISVSDIGGDNIMDSPRSNGSRTSRSSQSSGVHSSAGHSEVMDVELENFSIGLNGKEIFGLEDDDELDQDEIENNARLQSGRRELGEFIWRLVNIVSSLEQLLEKVQEYQEKGQLKTKGIDLELKKCSWTHQHIEVLRKSGCRVRKLEISWMVEEAQRSHSEQIDLGALTYIDTLEITNCSDEHLEIFSDFAIFNLVISNCSITRKALGLFKGRQVAIDRRNGLYRNTHQVCVTAKNNVRRDHGSSWDAGSLEIIASLPGLKKLTVDLEGASGEEKFDQRALEQLVSTIAAKQKSGYAAKDFCLSMKNCGTLSLDFIKGLAKCTLRVVDVSGCKHAYGADGSTAVAKALESPEWAGMDSFIPYIDTFSEPRGLFCLSLAALKHAKMSRFCLKVGLQEKIVQDSLRTNRPSDLPLVGLFGKLCKIFDNVAGPTGNKSQRFMRSTTQSGDELRTESARSDSLYKLDMINDHLNNFLFDFSDQHALYVWKFPIHFALGMASRCQFLRTRVASHVEVCSEYQDLFEQAATQLLDECNDRFEAEKILLDTGHRFIRGEHPLNYALRHQFVHFISCRWTKRYISDVWYSVDPWRSSTTEIGFGPVAEFTEALFAQNVFVKVMSIPVMVLATCCCGPLLLALYMIQMILGDYGVPRDWLRCKCCCRTREEKVRLTKGRNGAGALLHKREGSRTQKGGSGRTLSKQQSNQLDEILLHPGRWPRRLMMLLQLLWSTAVIKYYTSMWCYIVFLSALGLIGFRKPESTSGWNWMQGQPGVLIIWAYGLAWLLQEFHELCNRYCSITFLPDQDQQRNENAKLWPWQTQSAKRLQSVLIAHYNDAWNFLDLTIIMLVLLHLLFSTIWSNAWIAAEEQGLPFMERVVSLYPTRTEPLSRIVLAFIAILAWFRFLGLMKVHPKLGPLITISLNMFIDILQFAAMIWFIMMGFGTAFILLNFDNRDLFSNGVSSVYRVIWAGVFGEGLDDFARDSLECAESGPFLLGSDLASQECREVFFKDVMMKVYLFLMVVVFMNLLIAMLSRTYEQVEDRSILQWRLLLAQTTMEYYENVQHVWELAPLNLFHAPIGLTFWCLRHILPKRILHCVMDGGDIDGPPPSEICGRTIDFHAHFRPPWRKLPGEVDVSWKYGGQTLSGNETLGRRSLYLEEEVGYYGEEEKERKHLHDLDKTSSTSRPAVEPRRGKYGAKHSYREQDSHPQAWGQIKAWRSAERGGKRAAAERDLQDVTLKKQAQDANGRLSVDPREVLGESETDPLVGLDVGSVPGSMTLRKFMPMKIEERALRVIASDELYEELGVRQEDRKYFSSADLHKRWLDTMDIQLNDSVEGNVQTILQEVMLHREAAAIGATSDMNDGMSMSRSKSKVP